MGAASSNWLPGDLIDWSVETVDIDFSDEDIDLDSAIGQSPATVRSDPIRSPVDLV